MRRSLARQLKYGEPVHLWQAEIEDDGTIVLGVAAEPGLLAITHRFDHVAAGREGAGDVRGDAAIVFGQKNAHHFSFVRSIVAVLAST